MNTTKKSLATATVAATALAGFSFALAPAANAQALATKTFSKAFTQKCQTVGPFGANSLGATVSGVVPTAVKKGAAFNLTNAKVKTTIPATLNSAAFAAGGRSQIVTFTVINLDNTKIAPSVKNILTKATSAARTPIVAGQASSFTVPVVGGLTVPLKAGTTTGLGSIKSGQVTATFQLFDANGNALGGPQPVSCGAQNILLTTINITA